MLAGLVLQFSVFYLCFPKTGKKKQTNKKRRGEVRDFPEGSKEAQHQGFLGYFML
jgi:hypothetical protein